MKAHPLTRIIFRVLMFASVSAFGAKDADRPISLSPADINKYREDYNDVIKAINASMKDPKKKGRPIPNDKVLGWIMFREWSTKSNNSLWIRFEENRGWKLQSSYSIDIIKAFNASSNNPLVVTSAPTPPVPPAPLVPPVTSGTGQWSKGWEFRQSYTDVLQAEDPSLDSQAGSSPPTDSLKGGLISYTRNFNRGLDTWSAQAALMFPIVYKASYGNYDPTTGNLSPPIDGNGASSATGEKNHIHVWLCSAGFIPSVSIFRVTGAQNLPNNTTVKDVDQLTFRLGVFQKYFITAGPLQTFTLREAFLETTDTGFRLNAPSGQVELEPQAHFGKYFNLGFLTNLIPKASTDPSGKDSSYLAYQLRVLLHAEYGSILSSGSTPVVAGDFCRVGPVTELTFTPVYFKQLSLVAGYQYLPTFEGDNAHNSLFTSSAEWKFVDPTDTANQKADTADAGAASGGNQNPKKSLSLKVTYTNGGIDITKERVNTLVVGLGGTY